VKLCIPIRYKPEGGLYTFIANLLTFLDRQGVPYTHDLEDEYDALFVNSWVVPYETVARLKRNRPRLTVTQRVDGAAQDYGRGFDADREQARVNVLADLTIFQSEYSRFSTREKFPVIPRDGPVIYNPVDLVRFAPQGPSYDLPIPGGRVRLVNVSFSTNRKKGTWRIDELAASHPDLHFVLCGRYAAVAARPNVTPCGHVDRDTLSRVLRSCDLFLDLTENEACPNVVLEAMASGLPVLHNDSGAVPELVGDGGMAHSAAPFAEAVARVLADRQTLGASARARAEALFDPAVIFPRYLDAIRSAPRHAEPGQRAMIAFARQGYPVRPRPFAALRTWAGSLYRRSPRGVQTIVDRLRRSAPRPPSTR
jgi:glycosyltransferase involved in cell wall biosynthesis